MSKKEKEIRETLDAKKERDVKEQPPIAPPILEEITIEELAVDGICGIY